MSAAVTGANATSARTVPPVIHLLDPAAVDPHAAGAKAANVARLAALSLPVLDGFVLTTAGVEAGAMSPDVQAALREHWQGLGGDLSTPLVVRSSSTVEDAESSSMAGRFTSILDVRGWEAFTAAVETVVESGRAVDAKAPMAVLVQRQVAARIGGVLFGADPVAGRTDRIVVEWVSGRPDLLVGGRTTAAHAELTRRGRVVGRPPAHEASPSGAGAPPVAPLPRAIRRRLAAIAALTEGAFGAPQDIEWAVDLDGTLWVLQARPVTALHLLPPGQRRRFGRGPLAETFPHRLHRLEEDLWVGPLRDGLVRALRAAGAAADSQLERPDAVTTVAGWMVVDLDLIEGARSSGWRRLVSPRHIAHRLATAWRIGRLRAALPTLAVMVVQSADEHLAAVGRIGSQRDDELVELLRRSRLELATVHSYEMLSGMLLDTEGAIPAPMVALRAVHEARRDGVPDDEIVAAHPEVLALTAPSIEMHELIPTHAIRTATMAPEGTTIDDLSLRDALRLRVRWLHELQCRTARELGHRAEMRGALATAADIALLSLAEVGELCATGSVPVDFGGRRTPDTEGGLPAEFTLAVDGTVVPIASARRASDTGIAAGGGRATGIVVDASQLRHLASSATDATSPSGHDGSTAERPVLVTEFLDPSLAPLLPMLGGLVAESGSVLSHLAILARESGVPTVVAVPDARRRFPPGTRVDVDGQTGSVTCVAGTGTGTEGDCEHPAAAAMAQRAS